MSTVANISIRGLDTNPNGSGLTINSRESDELVRLAAHITADPTDDPEAFCRDAKRAAVQLPPRITTVLSDFGRWGSRTGIVVISGLPTGPIPDTPPDNTSHVGEYTLLSRVQALFNEFLGHMVAYEAEGHGRLFQDMVPSAKAARTQTSLSSLAELELHTEQAFSRLRPDYLSLACLRGDHNAQTYLFAARDLLDHLTADETARLREPRWITGVDESFRMGGRTFVEGDVRGPLPILSGSDHDPFIILDQDLMRGVDPQAQALQDRVLDLYPRLRRSHVLASGEFLLIDNARVVHGRSPFEPRFDGSDRFVIRSFVTNDLGRSRHARRHDSRIIAAQYS